MLHSLDCSQGWFQQLNLPHGLITGQLHKTNMDILAAPPGNPPNPITAEEFYKADLAEYGLPPDHPLMPSVTAQCPHSPLFFRSGWYWSVGGWC
ncbi:hypothetical protein QKW35_19850 [Pontibacterium granulatum]|uniref:hypothetical protein n=1 Tax=Pontibacterium granulatum TaxID=2036029 RepID=UPI00249C00AE|nr:hypothetical protein [Pontibacterium granulatum]MDI3326635.1 hypothetical protein [Pontibacterium granulatum]